MLNQEQAVNRKNDSPPLTSIVDLFDASSRLGRVRYISLLCFWLSVMVISAFCTLPNAQDVAVLSILAGLLRIAFMIVIMVAFLHIILIKKRRFNDFNYSGWWMLWGAIPGVSILLMLFLAIKAGSKGNNSFGEPGKETTRYDYILILLLPIVILLINLLGLDIQRS